MAELREGVTSCELLVESWKLKRKGRNSKVWFQIHELQVQIQKLRVEIQELQFHSHELQVHIYELRVQIYEFIFTKSTSFKLE